MTAPVDGNDGGASQHTVEELQQENEALRAEQERLASKGAHRTRRIFSWVLVVLACILAVVSVVVVFARNELLNTDTYVSTVAPLASNPAIQAQVAKQVSHDLIQRTDLQQRVKGALPPKAGFLATPITTELQNVTEQLTLKAVESETFQKLWVGANRASHKQLVALLTGSKEGAVSSSNGKVTLDLSQVEVQVKKALNAKGITVFNKVPAAKGLNFVLFQSDQLVKIQRLTRFLDDVALVLPIVTLLCFAGGVVLARNRRRGLVRAATGLALSMALILVVLAVVRNQYLASLSPSQSKEANEALIGQVTGSLRLTVRGILIAAAVVALAALLAGNRHVRAWVTGKQKPAWMTEGPVHRFVADHRRGLQWGALLLGLLVLVIWDNPTTRVAIIVVVIAFAVVGLIGLFAVQRAAPDLAGLGPPTPDASGPSDTAGGGTAAG
ncbi:MAG: hypothetical protein ACLQPH_13355 [Acidimicrobiales bacterium]